MTIFWIFLSFFALGIKLQIWPLWLSIPFLAFNYDKFSRKSSFPRFGFQQLYIYYIPQSKKRKIFFKSFSFRPSFNNNFCFIYFPLTCHVKRFSRCASRSECMWFCFLQLVSFMFQCFHFPPLLYSLQWKCMCVLFFCLYSPFAPFVLLMLFVLFFDLLYFSAKFSIFTSDVSRPSQYLLLVYILSDT